MSSASQAPKSSDKRYVSTEEVKAVSVQPASSTDHMLMLLSGTTKSSSSGGAVPLTGNTRSRRAFFNALGSGLGICRSAIGVGDYAPDFVLPNQFEKPVTLQLASRFVVLFFFSYSYGRVDSAMVKAFQNLYTEFQGFQCDFVGVSCESPAANLAFATDMGVHYHLISDYGNYLRLKYGVPDLLPLGLLPGRCTYVIDPGKTVRAVLRQGACMKTHAETVRQLLRKLQEGLPNIQGNIVFSAVVAACKANDIEALSLALTGVVPPPTPNSNPTSPFASMKLDAATGFDRYASIVPAKLLDGVDQFSLKIGLYVACVAGSNACVRFIGRYIEDIDTMCILGEAALLKAARARHHETVLTLIELGADVNRPDHTRFTPLHRAVLWKDDQLTSILLINGASMSSEDGQGNTPLDLAIFHNRYSFVDHPRTQDYINRLNRKSTMRFTAKILLHLVMQALFLALTFIPTEERWSMTSRDAEWGTLVALETSFVLAVLVHVVWEVREAIRWHVWWPGRIRYVTHKLGKITDYTLWLLLISLIIMETLGRSGAAYIDPNSTVFRLILGACAVSLWRRFLFVFLSRIPSVGIMCRIVMLMIEENISFLIVFAVAVTGFVHGLVLAVPLDHSDDASDDHHKLQGATFGILHAVPLALQTVLDAFLVDISLAGLTRVDRIAGTVYYFLLLFVFAILLTNLLIASLSESYVRVKLQVSSQWAYHRAHLVLATAGGVGLEYADLEANSKHAMYCSEDYFAAGMDLTKLGRSSELRECSAMWKDTSRAQNGRPSDHDSSSDPGALETLSAAITLHGTLAQRLEGLQNSVLDVTKKLDLLSPKRPTVENKRKLLSFKRASATYWPY